MPRHRHICLRLAAFPLLAFGTLLTASAAPPSSHPLSNWHLRLAPDQPTTHTLPLKTTTWLPAHVPGTVQTDLIAAGIVPDPFYRDQEAQIQWIGLNDWQYRTHFHIDTATLTRQHIELVFNGIDTLATVTLNGTPLLHPNNMFRRWRVDAKPLLKRGKNILEITLYSPIKKIQPWLTQQPYALPGAYDSAFHDEPTARHSATYVRKAPYQFGWDWGPRIVTTGLWKNVTLDTWDTTRINDLHIAQQRVDADTAHLEAQLTLDATHRGPAHITLQIFDPDGRPIAQYRQHPTLDTGTNHIHLPVRIAQPRRWFPVGYGTPDRYTFKATVRDAAGTIQHIERITGLRTITLRREPDQWGKSMTLVVNGIPIFAKGANLIPFDSIPSRVTEATIRRTLQDAHTANMNMLRVWGGGHYQDEHFYALADAPGIMIWQDFMFGGAIPPDDVDFRENVRQEAIEQLTRLRDHPSIVLWCGNNEVQTGWEHWGDRITFKQSLPPEERSKIERGITTLFGSVLREAVHLYSPSTPYWATSPGTDLDGPADQTNDGDMHYWKVWGNPALPVTEYLNITPRFMSEYGLQSFPDIRTIRTFTRPEDLSLTSQVMRAHQKFDNGNGNQRLLLYIRRTFGEPKDFESFIYLSQLMQAEGIAIAAQHLRAARPQTMGSLYWQLNDVWPGASWSSIDYAGRWKVLHYYARRFYAPLMITALRKDGMTAVSLVSDHTTPLHVHWRLRVLDMDGTPHHTDDQHTTLPPLSSLQVAHYSDAQLLGHADPTHTVAVFELLDGNTLLSRQTLLFDAAKHLKLPQTHIHNAWKTDHGMSLLTLTSPTLARNVWLSFGDIDAQLSDNAFDLLPGEPLTIHIRSTAPLTQLQHALHIRDLAATLAGAPPEPETAQ
ncbi:glycoside hydrolase family 2 protein [Xylella fastidiosa subsp. multiplex]|uniref:Beta-mannosidase B n=1 Tax=Xylella fastidiosa subsp. multiplex TaxID=644357 RepID=A0AAW6HTJ0_XYLFS|nr:glycoside hydrolase family 2 protein [Xylella fastidiosa subsp. multiplex]